MFIENLSARRCSNHQSYELGVVILLVIQRWKQRNREVVLPEVTQLQRDRERIQTQDI